MTEPEHETCKSLAEQLGKPYTAMSIGKLRAAVCSEEDLDGKYILPTGVLKITAQIKGEIKAIGNGQVPQCAAVAFNILSEGLI